MPAERLSMRKIREVLRLRTAEGLNQRATALSVGVSPSTVSDYESRAKRAGLIWPLRDDLDDAQIDALLFPARTSQASPPYVPPDCAYLHRELRRKGVTLMLLWQEYKEAQGQAAYQYSQFCETYRRFSKQLDVVMRQKYRAGEKGMMDFSGDGFELIDPKTGEVSKAELFVAVLAASNYTYAEAFPSQKLRHWIDGHIHAYEYFEGVPEVTVPDNPKTGVVRPCFYDPDLNPTYRDMARYYNTAIIPARPRKPRDKAKVEGAVLIAQRWIIAALRNHTFHSLQQLNGAIWEKLEEFNRRPFQKLDGNRRELWTQMDRPALKPLPAVRYTFAQWSSPKVNIDYHVEVEKHFYSVPYTLIHKKTEARFTASTVEIFFKGTRVAAHQRSYFRGGFSTLLEHRAPKHRAYAEWTPERIIDWAKNAAGPITAALAEKMIASRSHPEQGYRACLGLIRLCKTYGNTRMEAASERALKTGATSYRSMESILKCGLDKQPIRLGSTQKEFEFAADTSTASVGAPHENVRGRDYYH